jgi:hypothetical protein
LTGQILSTTTGIMAEGIDRKADERMEFTTSKDVTVAPTFVDRKFSYTVQGHSANFTPV